MDAESLAEKAIREAIERGEFDDLPGAGKPLDLSHSGDPEWWVKNLVEREGDVPLGDPQRVQQSRTDLHRVRLRAAHLNPTHATPRRPPSPARDRAPHDPGPRRAARPPTTTAGR